VVFFVVPLVPALRGSEIAGLRAHQAWAWLYAVNVYLALKAGWVLSYLEHLWSLAVEEHFYFLWPLVVWALGGRPRALMRTTLALAVLSWGARAAAALSGVNPVAVTVLTPFQLDALCLGGFFAVALRQPGGEAAVRRAVVPLAMVAGGLLAGEFALHRFTDFGLPLARAMRGGLFRLLCAALLLHALFAPAASWTGRLFGGRVLGTLGTYSYGLYVYHHFLSYYFVTHGTDLALARAVGSHTLAVALQAAGGMAASLAVAWLSYQLFERRFLELKRLWPTDAVNGRQSTVNSQQHGGSLGWAAGVGGQ
jgi:peptidoglycan/LPS O-acetylase OafA/YrhL